MMAIKTSILIYVSNRLNHRPRLKTNSWRSLSHNRRMGLREKLIFRLPKQNVAELCLPSKEAFPPFTRVKGALQLTFNEGGFHSSGGWGWGSAWAAWKGELLRPSLHEPQLAKRRKCKCDHPPLRRKCCAALLPRLLSAAISALED